MLPRYSFISYVNTMLRTSDFKPLYHSYRRSCFQTTYIVAFHVDTPIEKLFDIFVLKPGDPYILLSIQREFIIRETTTSDIIVCLFVDSDHYNSDSIIL